MPIRIDDSGLRPYWAELESLKQLARKKNRVEYVNNARYAVYVHEHEKYFVYDDDALGRLLEKNLQFSVERGEVLTQQDLENGMEAGAIEGINWHRESSFAFGSRPPVRVSEGLRKAHRGGWADITGNLNARHFYKINNRPRRQKPEWLQEHMATRRGTGGP